MVSLSVDFCHLSSILRFSSFHEGMMLIQPFGAESKGGVAEEGNRCYWKVIKSIIRATTAWREGGRELLNVLQSRIRALQILQSHVHTASMYSGGSWKNLLFNIIKSALNPLMIETNRESPIVKISIKSAVIFKLFLPCWVFSFKWGIRHQTSLRKEDIAFEPQPLWRQKRLLFF